MLTKLRNLLVEEEGATLIEYALIVAVVAIVGYLGWQAAGQAIAQQGQGVAQTVNNP